jgi:hypothetical protein
VHRIVIAVSCLGLCIPAIANARSTPTVGTATFAAPREFHRKPAYIYLGDSQCSPTYTGLRWSRWGARRAVATGTGLFPHLSGDRDSCAEAAERANPRTVRVTLSRPHVCAGHWTFSRIAWTSGRLQGHYDQSC